MNPREQADQILAELSALKTQIETLEGQAEAEMAEIRENYQARLAGPKEKLCGLEKTLSSLMKRNIAAVFDGREKVSLKHGFLLHTRELKASIPRNALDKIEEQGWLEAVKVSKSVDRAVVEKWPDERLVVIGGKRRHVEKFTYEVKQPN
ncbi:MAG: host-nuclease inhibitor Gam family protein [Deltaproteobacteria bacterium]|nr:host-nuclease inhibitor Gam family protein [Deltaproteobacteria bacterium]MBW2142465.1 host-nuclease inhibitor Gam family protein [Deltaproteobacteria bacterium]